MCEKPWLERFCALLPASGSVLDCGIGTLAPAALAEAKAGTQRSQRKSAQRSQSKTNSNEDELREVGLEAVEVGAEDFGLGGVVDELTVFF